MTSATRAIWINRYREYTDADLRERFEYVCSWHWEADHDYKEDQLDLLFAEIARRHA